MKRSCGILMPIFSLPSKYCIGSFGKESRDFINFLQKSGHSYWQLLPLNPTSYGDSPYQSFSAFALNPYFIDLDGLIKLNYLTKEDVACEQFNQYIDYGKLYIERFKLLRKAYQNALNMNIKPKLEKFIKKNKEWLNDYACFMVLKGLNDGNSWQEWSDEYRYHSAELVSKIEKNYDEEYYFWVFLQYLAFSQYLKLKSYANKHGVYIIGDIPIYVALDSSDVWSNPDLFKLDENRRPTTVAGVPPDYFSADGQLWGNPLYDYDKMSKDNYAWWRYRVKKCAELFDSLRIDHFRGIDEYWSVKSGEKTARIAEWLKGPGINLINALKEAAPTMQFIAEDLGLLTNSVIELKNQSGWPGMKVYEFAFDSGYSNAFLPHNYEKNCVAYIGTHDNDTIANFIKENPSLHGFMKEYLHIDSVDNIIDTMIGTLYRSNADLVIVTIQDILHQGGEARINTPGTLGTNWTYRLNKKVFTKSLSEHLKALADESGRR